MKIMIRRNAEGQLSAYVPKKDLEEPVIAQERPGIWGGTITLANGWTLQMPDLAAETSLPITVEARKLAE
jgi:nitrogen fixation protein NifT